MNTGYILLWRRLTKKGYYKRSQYVHLWVHLLLMANHDDQEVMINGNEVTLHRGQLLTGRKKLSEETGIPESSIERILNVLKSGHQIEQQKTNKNRVITILNYDAMQNVNNKRTTNEQQADTNNTLNTLKEKDISKDISKKKVSTRKKFGEFSNVLLTEEEHARLVSDYGDSQVERFIFNLGEYMKIHGKSYKDHNLTIRNWMRREGLQPGASASEGVEVEI